MAALTGSMAPAARALRDERVAESGGEIRNRFGPPDETAKRKLSRTAVRLGEHLQYK
jgi:hypothetical protein